MEDNSYKWIAPGRTQVETLNLRNKAPIEYRDQPLERTLVGTGSY